jgi:hypothetical protein
MRFSTALTNASSLKFIVKRIHGHKILRPSRADTHVNNSIFLPDRNVWHSLSGIKLFLNPHDGQLDRTQDHSLGSCAFEMTCLTRRRTKSSRFRHLWNGWPLTPRYFLVIALSKKTVNLPIATSGGDDRVDGGDDLGWTTMSRPVHSESQRDQRRRRLKPARREL